MFTKEMLALLPGQTVLDRRGEKIGKVLDVYESGTDPEGSFINVSTSWLRSRTVLVPLGGASLQGADLVLPYNQEFIEGAPRVEVDHELSFDDEDALNEYFKVANPYASAAADPGAGPVSTGLPASAPAIRTRVIRMTVRVAIEEPVDDDSAGDTVVENIEGTASLSPRGQQALQEVIAEVVESGPQP